MFLSLFHVKHLIAGKLERQSPMPTQMAFLMSCLASDLRTILLCVFSLALVACAFSSLFPVPFAENSDSSSRLFSFSVRCQLYATLYFFLIVSRETFFYKKHFLAL